MEFSVMAENNPALCCHFTYPLVVRRFLSKLELISWIMMKFDAKGRPRSSDNLRKTRPKISIKIKDQCI